MSNTIFMIGICFLSSCIKDVPEQAIVLFVAMGVIVDAISFFSKRVSDD